ncbi:hypothetical protein B0H13DRAFT_1895768 [Mycena leptocephala]|nr:hypothetical protein B0H13DRAFT_1895768 [Mycena leptocephala]
MTEGVGVPIVAVGLDMESDSCVHHVQYPISKYQYCGRSPHLPWKAGTRRYTSERDRLIERAVEVQSKVSYITITIGTRKKKRMNAFLAEPAVELRGGLGIIELQLELERMNERTRGAGGGANPFSAAGKSGFSFGNRRSPVIGYAARPRARLSRNRAGGMISQELGWRCRIQAGSVNGKQERQRPRVVSAPRDHWDGWWALGDRSTECEIEIEIDTVGGGRRTEREVRDRERGYPRVVRSCMTTGTT